MEKEKRTLKISLSVIGISLILSIIAMMYMRVEEPVFIKNYCQYGVVDNEGQIGILGEPFILQYINNVDSNKKAITIEFQGYEELGFYASEHRQEEFSIYYNDPQTTIEKVGPYGVHNVYIDLPQNLDLENWKDISLSKAKIGFDDGSSIDVDLGNIVLYKLSNDEEKLGMQSSTSSIDGSSMEILNIKDDITIKKVEAMVDEYGQELITFKFDSVSDNESDGKSFKSGDKLYITGSFNGSDDILSKFTRYELIGDIYYTDYQGKEYIYQFNHANQIPYYTFNDVIKYLSKRGEL